MTQCQPTDPLFTNINYPSYDRPSFESFQLLEGHSRLSRGKKGKNSIGTFIISGSKVIGIERALHYK